MNLLGLHATPDRKDIAAHHRDVHLFLKEHPAGVLATVDPNNSPHAATIYFSVDSSLAITLLTKKGTKKSDNLLYNNEAMLVVFDADTQTTVQITGLVSQITDQDEVNQVFRGTLRASLHLGHSAVPPISKIAAGEYVAYCLMPTRVRYATFRAPEAGRNRKMFETIDLPL